MCFGREVFDPVVTSAAVIHVSVGQGSPMPLAAGCLTNDDHESVFSHGMRRIAFHTTSIQCECVAEH